MRNVVRISDDHDIVQKYALVEGGKDDVGVPWASVFRPPDENTHVYFGHDAKRSFLFLLLIYFT